MPSLPWGSCATRAEVMGQPRNVTAALLFLSSLFVSREWKTWEITRVMN